MKIKEITGFLETWAPPSLQESYDNSGLIIGDPNMDVTGVLICLDSTEEIIEEAIRRGCNLVVAHHPIVFSGLKRFNGKNYIERTVMKAIKQDVAVYAIHTNLDNVKTGVNKEICDRLGLSNVQILSPKKEQLSKLMVYVPRANADDVRDALFDAGAGHIGDYDSCSFSSEGIGSFRGGEGTNPHVGEQGKMHFESELKLEVIVPAWRRSAVMKALVAVHPYEEIAFDWFKLENVHREVGSGMIGDLPASVDTISFLETIKSVFNTGTVKYTQPIKKEVKRIAVCGGSGSFLLGAAKANKADVFITADYKYHQFFDADGDLVIADIGHYESEQYTIELIGAELKKKFPKFAIHFTELNTNPVNYL